MMPLPYYYSSIMMLAGGGGAGGGITQKHCMPSYLPYVFHEASRTPSSITDPILMGFLTTMLVLLVLLLEFEAYAEENRRKSTVSDQAIQMRGLGHGYTGGNTPYRNPNPCADCLDGLTPSCFK